MNEHCLKPRRKAREKEAEAEQYCRKMEDMCSEMKECKASAKKNERHAHECEVSHYTMEGYTP